MATTTTTYTTPGTYKWTAPFTGSLSVQCVAGGGGGGGQSSTNDWGCGGGGGEYAAELTNTVTAGNVYTIVVGAAGTAGASSGGGNGGTGGNSSFTGTGATTVTANGGGGGAGSEATAGATTGGGAGGSGSTNSVHNSGGTGGGGTSKSDGGGGGGSSGGSGSAGNNGAQATSSSGGAGGAAVTGGGPGGNGGDATSGSPPSSGPGGGGGGACGGIEEETVAGGAGYAGQVTISYTTPTGPFVVQQATGTATNTTGVNSLTLGAQTTSGNAVLVIAGALSSTGEPTINSCKLGGVTDNFAYWGGPSVDSSDSEAGVVYWLDPGCAGGQTAISVSLFGTTGTYYNVAVAYEVGNLPATAAKAEDVANANPQVAAGSSWTSGTTGTTAQASEIWFGCVIVESASATITGPGGNWTNTTVTVASHVSMMTGFEVVSSSGAASYAGSLSTSELWSSSIGTLKALSGSPPQPVIVLQAVRNAAYY
jgi:hypothetical protein